MLPGDGRPIRSRRFLSGRILGIQRAASNDPKGSDPHGSGRQSSEAGDWKNFVLSQRKYWLTDASLEQSTIDDF